MAMKFIKTVNSPVDTADFAEELETNGIEFEYGDSGDRATFQAQRIQWK